jgi:histidinol-phosphatase
MRYEKELDLAQSVARRAAEVAQRYLSAGVTAENKPDDSPVTIADRECEKLIAAAIVEAYPDDGILGEEGAARESRSGRRWIIDPIDGTRDFIRGNRHWAVLIGLEDEGDAAAGVCYLPGLSEMYFASRGGGAWRDGTRIHVSAIDRMDQAVVCFNGFQNALKYELGPHLLAFLRGAWAVRSMGGAPDAMMIAAGHADAWIEPVAKAWDLAPLKVIIEEAGGKFFNFDGGSSIYGGNCAACVPALEAELRRFLSVVRP